MPRPATNLIRRGSTPVWLAIWCTWAGFANSQLRRAAFCCTCLYICPSPLLPPWAAAQTDANLSAHLHRLPTPPSYLRRMRLSPGLGSSFTAQSKAPSRRATCRTSSIGTSNLPNRHLREEQPAEPAASGRATCRTSSIGRRIFWQIMVPKGQVLRG